MEFNEQKALEIIAKYNFKPVALQVWKTRGYIPDKYYNEFKPADSRSDAEIELDHKVMTILANKKLNLKAIFNDLEIPIARYSDAKRIGTKTVPLQALEVTRISIYLINLHRKLSYDISIFSGRTSFTPEERFYIEDTLIQYPINALSVLECEAKDKIYCRFLQRKKNPKGKFEDWEVLEMWSKLFKLLKEIEI